MISEQGAILIATVYPIGLLLGLVEVRPVFRKVFSQVSRGIRALLSAVMSIATGVVLYAVFICIQHVSSGVALKGYDAGYVCVAGGLLGIGVLIAVGAAIAAFFFEE